MTDRIMPVRWFFGSGGQRMIPGVTRTFGDERRELAPGERRLGAFIVPPFQRGLIWTPEQKVRLIESLYIGMPIGAIVYNNPYHVGPTDGWLLDGQQRLTAITEYLAGVFPVSGWLFPDLPVIEQRHFQRLGVMTIETQIDDPGQCREVYDRLVYGGTPHEAQGGGT